MDTRLSEIEKRFATARPKGASLAFYTMDWAPDLAAAQVRGKKERRPVFFILVTNVSAATSFYQGHC
ncbi:hypothetical protein [Armatimonas sp.]|uniref:hypothetical protein n=1 Tax=Armatimonas sp. TaxID=1872638 RepID=UPI00286BA808|nr:hypothetical protein [Armatimonas sp.]